jgi:hypothetical protein
MCCLLLTGLLAVPAADAQGKAQDAILISHEEIPSGPATPFDQTERHLEWKLRLIHQKDDHPAGSVLHGLNVATGGTNRRALEEENLEKQLQDLEASKSQYELNLSKAGLFKQPCSDASAVDGCIKPVQSQYLVKIGRKSVILLTPMQAGSKGNLYGLAPGTSVQIKVGREYVTIRVDGNDCQYNLLEAAW